ncbi:MAG: hypothetical protein P1V97_08055 [Planctomycetota bacterium]|nr:hypothetical protein [Planctomycetota bacterium]
MREIMRRPSQAVHMKASLIVSIFLAAACSGSSGGGSGPTTAPTNTSPQGSSVPAATSPAPTTPTTPLPTLPTPVATGTLSVLSYNVAGLPQGISSSSPATNTPQISPKLNSYDLVLAQEDFSYHTELARDALHSFQSSPLTGFNTPMGDGLNRFSNLTSGALTRQKWFDCHGLFNSGSDCLASKGFSFSRIEVAPGIEIDVYNLHADAGRKSGDIDARRNQFIQLTQFIWIQSNGRPLIVAGDTNLRASVAEDEQILQDFLAATGLEVAARTLGQVPDKIDRIMIRSANKTILTAQSRRIASEFVDSSGADLSDHEAIHVDVRWEQYP